jgi:hypothetical protein
VHSGFECCSCSLWPTWACSGHSARLPRSRHSRKKNQQQNRRLGYCHSQIIHSNHSPWECHSPWRSRSPYSWHRNQEMNTQFGYCHSQIVHSSPSPGLRFFQAIVAALSKTSVFSTYRCMRIISDEKSRDLRTIEKDPMRE